ncbi:hypothetical protein OS493_021678 [Desmophyllum pertusum]|uniref:UPAR/Ly6 domain-containing protein n=1 Tax=Desmophyllum pertusum TaxID=174260 RepID=A0A9W9YB31_9CNID|nr:hypothetical protein OS493_021678 [Desmophyllum pertusum]
MNLLLKVTCFLLLFIRYAALGLNCHKCSSRNSWQECDTTRLSRVSCTGSDAVCYKVHYTTDDRTIQQFSKSCGPKSFCEKTANPVCKVHLGSSNCEIDCCEEDMCNSSSVAGVSGLVVLLNILVAMVYW